MTIEANGMFKWAESEGTDSFKARGFDCAVAAVQDRFNPLPVRDGGSDFSCAGEGPMRLADDELRLNVYMKFSDRDRVDDTVLWSLLLGRDGEMAVTVPSWNYFDRSVDDLTYTDKGGGNFITGYMRAPRGWWHLAISLDRRESQRVR